MKISQISNQNFSGVYLSNRLAPGTQRYLGKEIRDFLNKSGIANEYEKDNKDILIKKGPKNGISIVTSPLNLKRILDDEYSRWNGRFN